jgi:threonylcarbamoyladenosine tRNA methylthiotransferase MtaB
LLTIENSSAQNTRKSIRSRIAFHTLGCKLNFSETASISRKFDFNKYKQVDFSEIADVYVINTCSVTENGDIRF